ADRGGCAASIGFTFRGLAALGLEGRRLEVFQERTPAFAEGPFQRAARRLADTGPSRPELWDRPYRPEVAHLLLMLHGDDLGDLVPAQQVLRSLAGDAFQPKGWADHIDGSHLDHTDSARTQRRVHFGYLDGISRTGIEGFPARLKIPGTDDHQAGEFLLGY